MNEIKRYRRKLDQALHGGPDALLAFMRRQGLADPSCREALLTTFHKTMTASVKMPIELRRESKQWLVARGYHSLDDGAV